MGALLQTAQDADLPGGYGVALLQTILALTAVCILAWVVLRWGAKRGLSFGGQGARVRVIERVVLDARRSLYLVRVGDKVLLIGAGESGAPAVLAELSPDEVPELPAPSGGGGFAEVLKRIAGRSGSGTGTRTD
jgi:flagellar biosynthetic protein FliO